MIFELPGQPLTDQDFGHANFFTQFTFEAVGNSTQVLIFFKIASARILSIFPCITFSSSRSQFGNSIQGGMIKNNTSLRFNLRSYKDDIQPDFKHRATLANSD